MLSENDARLARLAAAYDPVTGEGLESLTGKKRVRLSIPDFAIPVQWVPEEMMNNRLVKGIARAGSIEKYISQKKWKYGTPPAFEIERELRRVRHKYDFPFWAYFCIRIVHKKERRRVPFVLNLPQLMVLSKCEELRGDRQPINLIILKARQWGGSTFCFFYQCWLLFKWNELHSFAIAAHNASASQTILQMLKRSIQDYPAWDLGLADDTRLRLAPADTTGHAYAIKDDSNNQVLEGFIYIGTAENPDTLRSKDICGVHYSEVGIWPDTPQKRAEDIVADIQGGLLDSPDTMQVMESTAKSPDDYFHSVWEECEKGAGGYAPLFVPAYQIGHDARPVEDREGFAKWLLDNKDNDTPEGTWKDSGRYYWWLWEIGATLEHINWYRYRRFLLSFTKMCNEAPETPAQAFFTAGNHVFDPFMVAEKARKCRPPRIVGELVADGAKGEDALKNIRFIRNGTGQLRIWEMPDESPVNDRYVVVLDPRRGASDGADPACLTVIDRLLMMSDFGLDGRPGVVAEMNYNADPDLQAYDAMRVAQWYGHALLVIESNTMESMSKERNNGVDSFEYIMDIVARLYGNLYMRTAPEESVRESVLPKWGFHTNPSTKPKIINFLKECLRDNLWEEPSSLCLNQMSTYLEDHGKTEASHGSHDDVVMSRAIGLWVCYKEMPLPTWRKAATENSKPSVKGDYSGLTNL